VADLLVDTDVFVDHLRGHRAFRARGEAISYSAVTLCELFSGTGTDEEGVRRLLSPFRLVAVDRAVAEAAGRLRRQRSIRPPDAIIAATAIVHRLRLVTRNLRDFADIPRLGLSAPR